MRSSLVRYTSPTVTIDALTDGSKALRVVPPVGRKKENTICRDGPKLCGRNELISQKIELWMGVHRDRKQVSSHIQVLRNFMFDNKECKFEDEL